MYKLTSKADFVILRLADTRWGQTFLLPHRQLFDKFINVTQVACAPAIEGEYIFSDL